MNRRYLVGGLFAGLMSAMFPRHKATVTNLNADGPGSLRDALDSGADIQIQFVMLASLLRILFS